MNIFKKPAARFLAKRSALGLPAGFATIEIPQLWALNSAVECHLHTVEVTGLNPVAPTIYSKGLRGSSPKSPPPKPIHIFIESSPTLFHCWQGCLGVGGSGPISDEIASGRSEE